MTTEEVSLLHQRLKLIRSELYKLSMQCSDLASILGDINGNLAEYIHDNYLPEPTNHNAKDNNTANP